jgi:hypothetical protein
MTSIGPKGCKLRNRLRLNQDIAGPTMKVRAALGMDGLEAIRDGLNDWHLGVVGLSQTGRTDIVTLRAD